jgi:hypothetical protein
MQETQIIDAVRIMGVLTESRKQRALTVSTDIIKLERECAKSRPISQQSL